MGEKGQVVIPRDIREILGVREGEEIVFEVVGDEVKIKKKEEIEKFLKEFFSIARLKKDLTIRDLKKIEEESYDLPWCKYIYLCCNK